jgi:hypothetical protein
MKSEVIRVRKQGGKTPPRDMNLHGGARGGDPGARKIPNTEDQEPPIVERTP